jgi:hypothetical protein
MRKLKCENCRFFYKAIITESIKVNGKWKKYKHIKSHCKKLNHDFKDGYAMEYRSKRCGVK